MRPRSAPSDREAIEQALPPELLRCLQWVAQRTTGAPDAWWHIPSARVVAEVAAVERVAELAASGDPRRDLEDACITLGIDPESHRRNGQAWLAAWRKLAPAAEKFSVTGGRRGRIVSA